MYALQRAFGPTSRTILAALLVFSSSFHQLHRSTPSDRNSITAQQSEPRGNLAQRATAQRTRDTDVVVGAVAAGQPSDARFRCVSSTGDAFPRAQLPAPRARAASRLRGSRAQNASLLPSGREVTAESVPALSRVKEGPKRENERPHAGAGSIPAAGEQTRGASPNVHRQRRAERRHVATAAARNSARHL